MFYKHAKEKSMFIIAFPITSASEIPAIINSKEFSIDILLIIPDNTLGSTKIVEYVIKESLRRKIPVVGYNSWFAKNGALLSFIIDYRDMGIQTGEIAKRILLQSPAEGIGISAPEKIKISVNLKIAKKLDIKISSAIVQQSYEVTR
jgi:putative ABC transport system substrate-binding protein